MEVTCRHCGETWSPADILERERVPFVAGAIVLHRRWDLMWGTSKASAAGGDLAIAHCPSCPQVTLVVAEPRATEPFEIDVEVVRSEQPELPFTALRPN